MINKELSDPVQRLYSQIRKMPELTSQAKLIDHVLSQQMGELKITATKIVEDLNQQKKVILQRFDEWIMPIAQQVLENFIKDAARLKDQLELNLEHMDQIPAIEWEKQADHWIELYHQWNDRPTLIQKILRIVAERTQQLIDKDIQVIKDYQTHNLSHLDEKSEALNSFKKRLSDATEGPLNQLLIMRNQPKEHTSLQQASEWIANLQHTRESYFDQLLMRIDDVMQDVVKREDKEEEGVSIELEGEILFMERELKQIKEDLFQKKDLEEADKQWILGRLEGLLDHIQQFEVMSLSYLLRKRIQMLKTFIHQSLDRLKE